MLVHQLQCASGDEASLSGCQISTPEGLRDSRHSADVGVACKEPCECKGAPAHTRMWTHCSWLDTLTTLASAAIVLAVTASCWWKLLALLLPAYLPGRLAKE